MNDLRRRVLGYHEDDRSVIIINSGASITDSNGNVPGDDIIYMPTDGSSSLYLTVSRPAEYNTLNITLQMGSEVLQSPYVSGSNLDSTRVINIPNVTDVVYITVYAFYNGTVI
jgi:hypothetical protein